MIYNCLNTANVKCFLKSFKYSTVQKDCLNNTKFGVTEKNMTM